MAVKEDKMEKSEVESEDSEEPRIGVFVCHCEKSEYSSCNSLWVSFLKTNQN